MLLFSFQASQDYETISWSAAKRLSWSDFQGEVPAANRAAAITASGITYRFSTAVNNAEFEVDFKVDAFFYPAKSWYRPELCDRVILSHEQLHFDISALFARKLQRRLEAETFTHTDVKPRVKLIYKEILKELDDFQNKYDAETNFSRNRTQQTVWNAKISEALKSK